jgi:uncharacterized protein
MHLTVYPTAADYLAKTQAVLERNEVANNLMLGVCLRLLTGVNPWGNEPPYLVAVTEGESAESELLAAASMTPPFNLIVFSEQEEVRPAFTLIARNLLARQQRVPGVNGLATLSRAFAQIWGELTAAKPQIKRTLRAFELHQVIHPTYPSGHLRIATPDDLALLTTWRMAFTAEVADPPQEAEQVAQAVRYGIEAGSYFVWDNQGAVALAAKTRPTTHGIAIGPVYTPPAERNKGYASALVAELSQRLLEEGYQFCTLFTDLANPTSNRIYQKIGYRPVCDFVDFAFGQI